MGLNDPPAVSADNDDTLQESHPVPPNRFAILPPVSLGHLLPMPELPVVGAAAAQQHVEQSLSVSFSDAQFLDMSLSNISPVELQKVRESVALSEEAFDLLMRYVFRLDSFLFVCLFVGWLAGSPVLRFPRGFCGASPKICTQCPEQMERPVVGGCLLVPD